MRINGCFISLLLCSVLLAGKVAAQRSIVVNIRLCYVDGRLLSEKDFVINTMGGTLIKKARTDKNGYYSCELTRGEHATIDFDEAGNNYSFKLEVPPDLELNVYQKTCKISQAQGATASVAANRPLTSVMKVFMKFSSDIPVGGQYISVYNAQDEFMKDVQTDNSGNAVIAVNKNEMYRLITNISGREYHAEFVVPQADSYCYQFIIPAAR